MDSRFGSLVGSELLELYSGFQSPGFRILVLQGKISRILKYRFPYLKWGEGGGGGEEGGWTRIRSVLNNEAKKVWPACIRCSFTRSGHEVVDTDNQGFCRTTIRITKIDHKWSPTTILKMDKPKMTPDLIWLTGPLMISTFLLSDHRIKTWSYSRVYFLYWLLWPQFFWCHGRLQRSEIDLGAGRPVGATEGIFMYHQIVHPVAKTEYGRVIKKTAQSQMNAVIVNSGVLVQCEILVIIVYVCINSFWPFLEEYTFGRQSDWDPTSC